MKWHEFDWRFPSTQRIFLAISAALEEVYREIESQNSYQQGESLEYVENLFGLAFVMAQIYISGTIADVREINPTREPAKEDLLKYSNKLPGSQATKIEFLDAIANYFKHHEEWANWSTPGRPQKTVSIFRAAGLEEGEEFLCLKAARILGSRNDVDLDPLLTILTDWRKEAILHATTPD